jgi:hypothetical protein
MTALLPASRDRGDRLSSDTVRPPTIQPYFLGNEGTFLKSPIPEYDEAEYPSPVPSTTSSRFPSSPEFPHYSSNILSHTPTLSSLSLDAPLDREEDEIALPTFDAENFSAQRAASFPETELSATTATNGDDTSTFHVDRVDADATGLHRIPTDDSSIEEDPERNVDYLSHEWREEDIWASWRYVISRRARYSNGVRLENASWRTWAKSKYKLQTVSPETLNWLKDCDVTWLYGPLQTDNNQLSASNNSASPSRLSSTNSFQDRKSILKKKTASEAILQRSLSQHTLLKHAGAILQAQTAENGRGRPNFDRAASDVGVLGRRLDYSFGSSVSKPTNSSSSGLSSTERRHIHFSNEVVQCIAVEEHESNTSSFFLSPKDDTESDDGVVMMKQVDAMLPISNRSTPRSSFSSESKTIAPLPSTSLKYRRDAPEPPPWNQQNHRGSFFNSSTLSPSPSVETLRPTGRDANFLRDDEYGDVMDWQPDRSGHDFTSDRPLFVNPEDEDDLEKGGDLHISPSGIFMPYEEGASSYTVLFGRVVDTVNTARDIAHVIWNVGW